MLNYGQSPWGFLRIAFVFLSQAGQCLLPPERNRKEPWEYDQELYRQRNIIERAFNKPKHWRRKSTRYERRSIYYLSALYLVSSVIWGQQLSILLRLSGPVADGACFQVRRTAKP